MCVSLRTMLYSNNINYYYYLNVQNLHTLLDIKWTYEASYRASGTKDTIVVLPFRTMHLQTILKQQVQMNRSHRRYFDKGSTSTEAKINLILSSKTHNSHSQNKYSNSCMQWRTKEFSTRGVYTAFYVLFPSAPNGGKPNLFSRFLRIGL